VRRLPTRARQLIPLALLFLALPSVTRSEVSAEPALAKASVRRVSAKADNAAKRARTSPPCLHVVRRGESVSRIAAEHRVTRQSVITGNHLANGQALHAGQRLRVPGCSAVALHRPAPPDSALPLEGGPLLARVGPRRIPTRLFLALPEFTDGRPVEFQWPVEGPIASAFGRRAAGWHAGVDIQAELGVPVHATSAGTVVVSGWERFYGNMIKLQHAGGFMSTYAHNLENLVEVGDVVEAGAVIATVGRSGRASASHLHFEIRREGVAYNPLYLLEMPDGPVLASAPEMHHDNEDESGE
jgi:murein DD-endopeptidase MepM/ murein hydrolase activator NlpD